MLAQLAIRDIVLIDKLDLAFDGGMSVLTGETGAGKSILLDAFALALGGRGDAGLVRHGAEQGQVTAVFDLAAGHPARALVRDGGLDAEGDLILRRVQYVDGRTRAFVNDQAVSVQLLRLLGATLVEIHGQHDDRALVDPMSHRALLDAYGGLTDLAGDVARRHAGWRATEKTAAAERARLAKAEADADFIRHAVEELTKLKPEPGEEATLAERRAAMMRAEKVAQDLEDAHSAVAGNASPVPQLAAAARRLERRGGEARELVEPAIAALDQALGALDEARSHLEHALALAAFDPHELERIEERLFALRAASRKYAVAVDGLAAKAEAFAADLAALDRGAAALKTLDRAARAAEAGYREAAAELSAKRQAVAAEIDAAVNAELPALKLERARFFTQIAADPAAGGPDGYDTVAFWVQTNPGTKPGPIAKIASGGELSRFMLALKVALADRGSAPTLVFDEIDSGVGGAVADAIGVRLARLAERVQVVTVTHAPQVAARASRHFLIQKENVEDGGRVATRVSRLEKEHRREEIARMLSGAEITREARAAAAKLIKDGR
ncbi:DNA repair protein RecN [Blastochloris viridis]|uniref:DNA repair protein RecN n=1 Tax=Blastochloris viridis TaxID=1079 RepID=A0A0H5BP00_BLAVI|nr:DNA repair protein RecN [Blastochloris viridis]ALK08212.1 DNA repair protein RecN [Blastochloris viridis]BAR98523.1 DNA repair protein RecN [Blastochloris viridis]CUU44134.1 Recombination protein N [Blastochloris viridis]